MDGSIIPLLQLCIIGIVVIMFALIAVYIYLMKPKNKKPAVQHETIIEDEEHEKKK